MRPAGLRFPFLLAAAGVTLSGCLAPAGSAVVAGSAAAGASSAAMKADAQHPFGSERATTQVLMNPAFSAAPGAVIGGAAIGSIAGASVRAAQDPGSLAAPAYAPGRLQGDFAQHTGQLNIIGGPLFFADGQPVLVGADTGATLGGGGEQNLHFLGGDHIVPLAPISPQPAYPWVITTPIGVYDAYVADEMFVDEDRRPWRAEMARRFAPVVAGCKSRREAIIKVAERCADVCGVKYSTKRRRANQCVAESLETGTASCTGLSVLLAAAYRSVGIPARLAQVAEWSDRPGNHTWVEVWDEDGWHFIEYHPDKAGLDHGWLLEPCAKLDTENPASRVVARTPERVGSANYFLAWDKTGRRLGGEDRTAFYQERARALGITVEKTKADRLVIIGAPTPETRAARPFRVLDASGAAVATGTTPGPLDDANNAPRLRVTPGAILTIEITEPDGRVTSRQVTAGKGDTEVR